MGNSTNRLLWLCLVASLLIYPVLTYLAKLPPNPDAPIQLLFPILAVIALGEGAGSLLYRRHALARPIESGELDPSEPEGMKKAFVPFMINLVIAGSVGIYGLVLSFLSGDLFYSIGFTAGALVLMFLHRPTAADLNPVTPSRML